VQGALHSHRKASPNGLLSTDHASEWIFILSLADQLYVSKKVKGIFHHSSFLGGAPVKAAGKLTVSAGRLEELYFHSGHYRPNKADMRAMLSFLDARRVDLASVQVDVQAISKVSRERAPSDANPKKAAKKANKGSCVHFESGTWALGFLETKHLRKKLKLYTELESCVHHWRQSPSFPGGVAVRIPTKGIAVAARAAAASLAAAKAASLELSLTPQHAEAESRPVLAPALTPALPLTPPC
jgi:hypothetical protein